MDVLGKELPPEVEALYNECVEHRPDANLKFVAGIPAGLELQAMHVPDFSGDSDVRLAEDFEMPALVHELLHVLQYRRGYPVAATLGTHDRLFSTLAHVLTCCVNHSALEAEVAKREGLSVYWQARPSLTQNWEQPRQPLASSEGLLDAWSLADAALAGAVKLADLAPDFVTSYPQTWNAAQELGTEAERCRQPSGMRYRRSMADLLPFFDGLLYDPQSKALPPSRAIMLTMVVSEPQLARPAERLIELVPLAGDVIGFAHRQDRALFHYRFALPGKQRREIVEMRASLKMRTEDFLNKYWVPYTVDLKAGNPNWTRSSA